MKNQNQTKLRFTTACFTMLACFLTATVTYAKDYTFSWSANPDPVEGYKLYYKKAGDATPPLNGTGASEGPSAINIGKKTTFTITGLEDNTTYHFALTAYNGTDESSITEIITVFPSDAPADPALNPAPIIINISALSLTQ